MRRVSNRVVWTSASSEEGHGRPREAEIVTVGRCTYGTMCGPARVSRQLRRARTSRGCLIIWGSLPFQMDRLSSALVGCILTVLRDGCNAPQDDDEDASGWNSAAAERWELFG